MFGLFKTKPPLGPWEKAWTEHRMSWLADQFGMGRMLETPTLVPHSDSIPNVANLADAEELLTFVQSWLQLETGRVKLQLYSDVVSPDSIGRIDDDQHVINVTENELHDRDELLAKFAHSLARHAVQRAGLIDVKTSDDEWTIALLPVYLGLGIFVANMKVQPPPTSSGTLAWWSLRQRGTLPSRICGYALALRSWVCNDLDVSWTSALRQDALVAFQDGQKYLQKTSDSVFSSESATKPRGQTSTETLLDELRKGSPSRMVSAMWSLTEQAARQEVEPNSRIGDSIMDALRNKKSDVRAVAATTLPAFDRSQNAAHDLTEALGDASDEVRIAAAGALSAFAGVDDEMIVHDLTNALKDDERLVVFNAARSLTSFGAAAEPATKTLLQRLRRAMVECRDDDAFTLMWALNAVASDPQDAIRGFFGSEDDEFREFALEMLEQLREGQ